MKDCTEFSIDGLSEIALKRIGAVLSAYGPQMKTALGPDFELLRIINSSLMNSKPLNQHAREELQRLVTKALIQWPNVKLWASLNRVRLTEDTWQPKSQKQKNDELQ